MKMKKEFCFTGSVMPFKTVGVRLPGMKLGVKYRRYSRHIKRGPSKGKVVVFHRPLRVRLRNNLGLF